MRMTECNNNCTANKRSPTNQPWAVHCFNIMDSDEYHYYHGFQDMLDEHEDKVRELAHQVYDEYWEDEGMILEALKEAISESNTFAMLLIKCREDNDQLNAGRMLMTVVDRYLYEAARDAAEDKLSWR